MTSQLGQIARLKTNLRQFGKFGTLVKNCQTVYSPGENITIDEQLLAFRGRCGFRMHIPNKPAKYGIKIMMACDARSKFMLNAIPYLGKYTKNAVDV